MEYRLYKVQMFVGPNAWTVPITKPDGLIHNKIVHLSVE